jgi:mannitol-1-/sugar-/sorbitol-6-phosphatase
VDSGHAISVAWEHWADQYSVAKPQLSEALGGTSIDTIRKLVPQEEVQAAWAVLTEFELQTAHLVREVKGAHELIQTIPPGHWGIVTSSRLSVALARLDSAGLFAPSYLVTSDDYKTGKPSPEPYQVALKLVQKKPEVCLAFEDSAQGVEAARASGVDVVGMTTYSSARDLCTELYVADWTRVRITLTRAHQLSVTLVREQAAY